MEEIDNNNILIAEFLNWKKLKNNSYVLPKKLADSFYKVDSRYVLEFNTDWNWLIEVVEKILHICLELDSIEMYYNITDAIPNINQTYNACIEFIKWYNEQKQK